MGVQDWAEFREEMNRRILERGNLSVKRFWALDTATYQDGALPEYTKELMGLAASLVLRCDDCITYHLKRCHELGMTEPQFWEAINVGLVVGGSITIPHVRRAVAAWDELQKPTGS